MNTATLATRRFVAHARLFSTIAAVLVVITMLVTGLFAYLALAAITGVRESLSAATATDAAVQAQIRLAADPAAQIAKVHDVLGGLLGDLPVDLNRTLQSDPLGATLADGSETELIVGADPELEQRATLESGSWPTAAATPVETAIQADAATQLHLAVGDTVTIGEDETAVALLIVGTWLATSPGDPHWFGDSAVANGARDSAFGPLMIAEGDFAGFSTKPFARWTVIPDAARITGADVEPLDHAIGSMDRALRADPEFSASGVIFGGNLHDLLATLESGSNAVRGISPVPLVLVGVIGVMAIVQLARLLTVARAAETALLRARGTSRRQLTVAAALEALAVSLPASILGGGIGLAAIALLGRSAPPWASASLVAAIAVGVTVVALTVVVAADAARPASRDASASSGRARRAAGVAPVVFAVVAAGISLWQFLLYGSPLITNAAGEQHVDPIAVLAPSLGLVACSTIGLVAFPAIARLLERRAIHSRQFGRTLAASQVARRITVFAVPVLLVSLAVGGTTVAAAYAETWSRLNATAGEVRTGGDVQVALQDRNAGGSRAVVTASPYLDVDWVSAATPVLVADVAQDDKPGTLVGIHADSLGTIVGDLDGSLNPAAVAALLSGTPAGLTLPAGTTELVVDSAATLVHGGATPAEVRLWLLDDQGALVGAAVDATDGTAPVPPGVEPWTVVAVDATLRLAPLTPVDFTVTGIVARAASGDVPLDLASVEDWDAQPLAFPDSADQVTATGTDLAFEATATGPGQSPAVRFMPSQGDAPEAVPAVVTPALANQFGLHTGDSVSLQFAGSGLEVAATVVGTTTVIPGSPTAAAALVDLGLASDQLLRTSNAIPAPNRVWIATTTPAPVAAAITGSSPSDVRVTTSESGSAAALLGSAVTALWVGAIGALALAAVAVSAILASLVTARLGEVTVLRVLGMTVRQQSSSRRAELFWVTAYAVVVGLISGLAVSVVVVPDLARSAVLGATALLPAPLRFALVPFVAALVAFAATVSLVGVVYARRVATQAGTARPKDDVQ
ncbi:MAG: FtsX-like permease family protein [Rhodoglobus sp.]